MRNTDVPTDGMQRSPDTLWPSVAGVAVFVVVSAVDLSFAKADRRLPASVRRRAGHRLRHLPAAGDLCDAFVAGGIEALRAVARADEVETPGVWVCESHAAARSVLDAIYRRIADRGRHDGYDAGVCGAVAYVSVWLD